MKRCPTPIYSMNDGISSTNPVRATALRSKAAFVEKTAWFMDKTLVLPPYLPTFAA
jgi:hypothetical protein